MTSQGDLLLILLYLWIYLVMAAKCEFRENVYTVAPGIEVYAIQIPTNDRRLHYFLNGGKTELHRRFERDNGLEDDRDVFGDLKKVLHRRRRAVIQYRTHETNISQNIMRSIRQAQQYVVQENHIDFLDTTPIKLSDMKSFVQCKPRSLIIPTSWLAADKDTYLVPYCLDIPFCGGCCGFKACKPEKKASKSYYYKVWDGDINGLVPKEHIRGFTYTYHESCNTECKETDKSLSSDGVQAVASCRERMVTNSKGISFVYCGKSTKPKPGRQLKGDHLEIKCGKNCGTDCIFTGGKFQSFIAPADVKFLVIQDIDITKDDKVTIFRVYDHEDKCKKIQLTSQVNGREKIIIKIKKSKEEKDTKTTFVVTSTKSTTKLTFGCNKDRICARMTKTSRVKRIVRGEIVTSYEYPFMARIVAFLSKKKPTNLDCLDQATRDDLTIWEKCNNNVVGVKRHCGGSIINDRWILSAAHCFTRPFVYLIGSQVFLGGLMRNDPLDNIYWATAKMKDTIIHFKYVNHLDEDSDIALIRLNEKIVFENEEYISPVCLAPPNMDGLIGCETKAIGWGRTKTLPRSQELRQQKQGDFEIYKCEVTLPDHILCFKHVETNVCTGDSGGPLFCDAANDFYYQVGIIEAGVRSDNPDDIWEIGGRQQAVKVTSFLEWIHKHAGVLA